MRLRVLGCSGGELRRHRTTCFLLDGALAVDAGALAAGLSLDELLALDDVVLTHSHLDHVKDVPFVADLLIGRRARPLVVHASEDCVRTLRRDLFNGRLWPDFTRLPDRRHPVLELRPFDPRRPFRAGRFTFRPVPVVHPVESVGFVVSWRRPFASVEAVLPRHEQEFRRLGAGGDLSPRRPPSREARGRRAVPSGGAGAIAISGDTGPTAAFWRAVNRVDGLRALLVETSFPTRLQALADVSGHLTPRTLAGELAKVRRGGFPVLLYHLKPGYLRELRREIAALELEGVRILAAGDEFTF